MKHSIELSTMCDSRTNVNYIIHKALNFKNHLFCVLFGLFVSFIYLFIWNLDKNTSIFIYLFLFIYLLLLFFFWGGGGRIPVGICDLFSLLTDKHIVKHHTY